MKQRTIAVLGILSVFLMVMGAGTSHGYTIDGMLDDWGVDISVPGADRSGYLDTHLPTGSTVHAATEDNADTYREWTKVEPQWSHYNHCDAEALYLDNDHTYLYVAVVTGLRKEGYDPPGNPVNGDDHHAFKPGDIGIDTDGDGFFEYGIDVLTGTLMKITSWEAVYYNPVLSPGNPYRISSGYDPVAVPFVYSEEQNTHYVLETAIPLSCMGIQAGRPVTVHWGMECGNDLGAALLGRPWETVFGS